MDEIRADKNLTPDEALKLLKTFREYARGNQEEADKKSEKLGEELKLRLTSEYIRNKTGISHLENKDIKAMLTITIQKGIKAEKAPDFLIKGITKIKELDPKSYTSLIQSTGSGDLSRFISYMIDNLTEGQAEHLESKMRIMLQCESYEQVIKQRETLRILQLGNTLIANQIRLQQLMKKSPEPLSKEIAQLKYEIEQAQYDIAISETTIILAETKRAFTTNLLAKPGFNPDTQESKNKIKTIYSCTESMHLRVNAAQYGLSLPPELRRLQVAELKIKTLDIKRGQAEFLAKNDSAREAINDFYKTGKLEGDKKGIFDTIQLSKIKYIKTTIEGTESVRSDMHGDFEKLSTKHDRLDDVPKDQYQEAITRMCSYQNLLRNTYQLYGKLLATYQTREFAYKREYKEEIAEMKKKLEKLQNK